MKKFVPTILLFGFWFSAHCGGTKLVHSDRSPWQIRAEKVEEKIKSCSVYPVEKISEPVYYASKIVNGHFEEAGVAAKISIFATVVLHSGPNAGKALREAHVFDFNALFIWGNFTADSYWSKTKPLRPSLYRKYGMTEVRLQTKKDRRICDVYFREILVSYKKPKNSNLLFYRRFFIIPGKDSLYEFSLSETAPNETSDEDILPILVSFDVVQ